VGFLASITDDADAVTAATDAVEGTTVAADAPVYLHLLELLQTSDLGDANEEVIKVAVLRGVTAGSGGAAATENALVTSAQPTPSTATNTWHSSASTGGTRLWLFGWNIRIPTVWAPLIEHRPRIDAGEDPYSFRLVSAPTDSITVSLTHIWEEDV
jgi:hypothetical protein